MELEKLLDEAYKYLSAVNVSGDSVDYLAMARQKIRVAYNELRDTSKVVENG